MIIYRIFANRAPIEIMRLGPYIISFVFLALPVQAFAQVQDSEKQFHGEQNCTSTFDETRKPKSVQAIGTIVAKSGTHPTHGTFQSLVLRLDAPACFLIDLEGWGDSEPFEDEVTTDELQVVGEFSDMITIGKRYAVSGVIMPRHSAWHTTPVLIDVSAANETQEEQ